MATTVDYSYKQIWRVAYPILVSLLMEQMIVLTDTAFMGRVGEVELGAAAIAGVFYMVIFMAGHGFCVGTQILIARRNGERRYGEVGQVFYQGLYFLMALAAVLFVACQMYADEILSMMISSPNILAKAEDYIHWRVYGFFFAFAGGMFRSFYVGTTQTKTLTLNSIVMVLSNVVFNYVLVFGKCGLPALGIAGAAIGSSLAEFVSLLFFIGYTRAKIDCRHFGLSRFPALDIKRQRSILSVSMWVMVQSFVSLSTWFIFFVYIEHLGLYRASWRGVTCHSQPCTQHQRTSIYDGDSVCLGSKLDCQQYDRGWPDRQGGACHTPPYMARISLRGAVAAGCGGFPSNVYPHLHRHSATYRRCGAYGVGDVFCLCGAGASQRAVQQRVGHRRHPYGILA